jgi:hypothetical protein
MEFLDDTLSMASTRAQPTKSRKNTAMDVATKKPRGTREPLHRERIEREALALIEAQGLDAFTTRKLG